MDVTSQNNNKNANDPEPKKKETLYASHVKIHPQDIGGFFRKLKWWTVAVLLGIYYILPWFRWHRGEGAPTQAVLADMEGRRLYFFEIEIWPQEIYYLTGLLILAAVGLFFVTSLAGRVWCGFLCWQTVWTDLFMLVERWIEGDRNKRMRLDAAPYGLRKIGLRTAKHIAWLFISLATGGAWILYFNDAPTIAVTFFTGEATMTEYGFIGLFTATTYVLAGLAREQVCIYMCPWPRFQGAMFDEHSLLVTYEEWRGEPRGKAKNKEKESLGDCVDCNLCVNVCPTGIDIRNGSQMQCIGCALCVDACNSIMDKLKRPRGLVRYDSLTKIKARAEGRETKNRIIRPRTIGYVVLMMIVVFTMVYGYASRLTVELNVQRDRAPLFVRLSDGSIRNGYTLKILNMERKPMTFTLHVEHIKNARVSVVGINKGDEALIGLPVKPDQVGTYKVFVSARPEDIEAGGNDMDLVVTDIATGASTTQDTSFYGPDK